MLDSGEVLRSGRLTLTKKVGHSDCNKQGSKRL